MAKKLSIVKENEYDLLIQRLYPETVSIYPTPKNVLTSGKYIELKVK